ncbi:helix-hairpin-helix domain-containing protein [bacterium]|nr:helix-hairpin-helix domain-containing protein [bacterium]
MNPGHKNTYLTAVIAGCVLVCVVVLALRWQATAQRGAGPLELPSYRRSGSTEQARAKAPQGEDQKPADKAGPAEGAETGADAALAGEGTSDAAALSGMSVDQLRRLAEGSGASAAGAAGGAERKASADSTGSTGSSARESGGKAASAAAAVSFPLELNRASRLQLESVPGIGPVLAQRIIDYRKAQGRFSSLEQLDEVKGIGPKTLASLRKYLYLEKD